MTEQEKVVGSILATLNNRHEPIFSLKVTGLAMQIRDMAESQTLVLNKTTQPVLSHTLGLFPLSRLARGLAQGP